MKTYLKPEEIMDHINKKREERLAHLQSNSRPLQELVFTENFMVKSVLTESKSNLIKSSEWGSKFKSCEGGIIPYVTIEVTPENKALPIRRLEFIGVSSVRANDRISALIPKYTRESFEDGRLFYFDRDFRSEEDAIEITHLSPHGYVMGRDRSTTYDHFMKKES